MIGPKASIPAVRWAEKLSEPRALQALEGYLYRPPARPGAAATLAWIFDEDPAAALRRACARAAGEGAGSLDVGGPPGNYLVSGVDAESLPWFLARGFVENTAHVDLCVDGRALATDARVAMPADPEAVLDSVASHFGLAWRDECARAARHHGLWVTRDGLGITGFVAAGGNNADAGTFGPVGVLPRARGQGLGEALTRTALHHLAAQGFVKITVPWVEEGLVPFYRRVAPVLGITRRVRLAMRFAAG